MSSKERLIFRQESKMNINTRNYFRKISFISPALILLVLLTGFPLYQVIQMSFFDYSKKSIPIFSGFLNYTNVFMDPLFWNALFNTLIFTFLSVAGSLLLGLSAALLLNEPINRKIRGFFRSTFMIPWLFSTAAVSALWILILHPFGLLNWFLNTLGFNELSQTAWLSNGDYALYGIILANIWRGFPFMMLMILAGLQGIPESLYEAAKIDGAGFLHRIVFITIPQLKNILLTIITLETIWNFRAFDLVFLMTGGGPINKTEILSTYIYNHAFRSLDFGHASATAIFMLIIMVLISFVYLKNSVRKED